MSFCEAVVVLRTTEARGELAFMFLPGVGAHVDCVLDYAMILGSHRGDNVYQRAQRGAQALGRVRTLSEAKGEREGPVACSAWLCGPAFPQPAPGNGQSHTDRETAAPFTSECAVNSSVILFGGWCHLWPLSGSAGVIRIWARI
jgi:hypothetical protein